MALDKHLLDFDARAQTVRKYHTAAIGESGSMVGYSKTFPAISEAM